MPNAIASLFTFQGRIDRARFFITGTFLLAIKYVTDAVIAAHFGVPWHVWNYFILPQDPNIFTLANSNTRSLYLTLWAVAIPFFWIGVAFTLRRLRDAGHRLGWVFLFFVPVANLVFFAWLCFSPTASPRERAATSAHEAEELSAASSTPVLGIFVAALVGLVLVMLSTRVLGGYGLGLFLGVPFIVGFMTSWFLNSRRIHSLAQTNLAAVASVLFIGLALIGFHWEGAICLLMALPLAVPFAIGGAVAAHACLDSGSIRLTPPATTACVALLPLLLFAEHAINLQPPTAPVVTSITINAPVDVVWKNVVAFPPLAEPRDWIFRTGIAYPIGATITGTGVGAIRRCRFSTGDFVEPITTWDKNHLLAFSVASQPPAMREIGFGKITTPHIDRSYMRSQHGQFRLVALDPRHTLLEGTTWYQGYFWPQVYWRGWSDAIVHRIHLRVLEHVRKQAEAESPASPPAAARHVSTY